VDALKTPTLFFIFPFTGLALSYFLVHLLAWYRTPKSSFHTVLEAFHLTPYGITMREAVVKTASSLSTAIFGGSAGPEGPATVLSGGVSVWLSKALKIKVDPGKALMIGVAAGFSAAFKTPLTGVLFALELPYRRDLEKESFIEAAIASSTAYLVAVALNAPSLLPGLTLEVGALSMAMLPISMIFGLLTGGVVIIFSWIYHTGEGLTKRLMGMGGYPLMLIVGGAGLGAIGYFSPAAVGPGFQMVPVISGGALATLIMLLVLKPISTTLTMNFGGTGGLFLPTLLIGGAWGAAFSYLFSPTLAPVFILMGMAAFSSGVHKMMLTPIVFVAEVFGANTIIPIILATVVTFFLTGEAPFYPTQPMNKLSEEELALERLYYKVSRSKPKELGRLRAADVMTQNPIRLRSDLSIRQAFDEFRKTPYRLMPVVDEDDRLLGYVTLEDLTFLSRTVLDTKLNEAGLQTPLVFREGDPVTRVIEEMIDREEDHCFVVGERGELTGIISTIDLARLLLSYYTVD
jgi:CIC family chloride channel protein